MQIIKAADTSCQEVVIKLDIQATYLEKLLMTTAIEIVCFKLAATAGDAQLLATNPLMEEFLNQQPGFMYRSLSRDNEGLWYDIIYWKNQGCAENAAQKFQESAVGGQIMPLIDKQSCKMLHMDALSEILSDGLKS